MTDASLTRAGARAAFSMREAQSRFSTLREGMLRLSILDALGLALGALLVAVIAYRALRETGQTNSYAALADAFLHGRTSVAACFDIDCVTKNGVGYVIFPPFPAVLAMPFVAVFGVGFKGFVLLGLTLAALSLWFWRRIARAAGLDDRAFAWFAGAILLASPLYYVTIRADGVWFFAQCVAFMLMSGALWGVLVRRSALIAGAFMAAAFLTRQMTILAAPAIFLMLAREGESLIAVDRARAKAAALFAAPILAALGIYFAYNAARFGSPLDTGYTLLIGRQTGQIMDLRLNEHGAFSSAYVMQNLFYLLVQGFHADFTGPKALTLGGLDPFGASVLAASPWLLLLLAAKADRRMIGAALAAAAIAGVTLFYHSNGFSQYNAQRYALDWLPLALVFLPGALKVAHGAVARGLILYGAGLNLAAMIVLQLTRG